MFFFSFATEAIVSHCKQFRKLHNYVIWLQKCCQQEKTTLTIFSLGAQFLHSIYVVNGDASGDVWPACGFTVHDNNVLQPWHVTQYGLRGWDRCRGLRLLVYYNSTFICFGNLVKCLLTLRRLCSRSLLVMMWVTSVSFKPWAMAEGPSVAYRVTTVRFSPYC